MGQTMLNRRSFIGAGSAALTAATFLGINRVAGEPTSMRESDTPKGAAGHIPEGFPAQDPDTVLAIVEANPGIQRTPGP